MISRMLVVASGLLLASCGGAEEEQAIASAQNGLLEIDPGEVQPVIPRPVLEDRVPAHVLIIEEQAAAAGNDCVCVAPAVCVDGACLSPEVVDRYLMMREALVPPPCVH